MMASRRTLRAALVLGGLGVAGLAVLLAMRAVPDEPRVPVARVAAGPLESWITTNGVIEPVEPHVIRSRVATFVQTLSAVEGHHVDRAEPLLALDVSEQRAELSRSREELAKAENELRLEERGGPAGERAQLASELKKAEAEAAHLRQQRDAIARLVAKQAATGEELGQADLALARAEATREAVAKKQEETLHNATTNLELRRLAVQRAREALRVVEEQVASADVRAPIAGTLYSLPLRPGARVEVGTVLAAVADLRSVQLRAFVDEPELAPLETGQRVEVSWSAQPGHVWTGRIERVPRMIEPRGERRVGDVICSVDNEEQQLIPNLDVDVRIRVQSRPRALLVPRAAVRGEGSLRYVFVVRDRVLHRQPVAIDVANATSYAVGNGVREGETVAVPRDVDLRDGMRIEAAEGP